MYRVLANVDAPLRQQKDVEGLGLGKKTTEKVMEILSTGRLMRSEHLRQDERHNALSTFMKIWGAARTTAESWYQSGKGMCSLFFSVCFLSQWCHVAHQMIWRLEEACHCVMNREHFKYIGAIVLKTHIITSRM